MLIEFWIIIQNFNPLTIKPNPFKYLIFVLFNLLIWDLYVLKAVFNVWRIEPMTLVFYEMSQTLNQLSYHSTPT